MKTTKSRSLQNHCSKSPHNSLEGGGVGRKLF